MNDLYLKLQKLLRIPEILAGSAPLARLWSRPVPPEQSVVDFFAKYYPTNGIAGQFKILQICDIVDENRRRTPGCFLNPFGILVFGVEPNGDAICVDGVDGQVIIVPHSKVASNYVSFGWQRETQKIEKAPHSREAFHKAASAAYSDLRAFFLHWIASLEKAK